MQSIDGSIVSVRALILASCPSGFLRPQSYTHRRRVDLHAAIDCTLRLVARSDRLKVVVAFVVGVVFDDECERDEIMAQCTQANLYPFVSD